MTTEYTSEENKELIETIKRPIRHYRIQLWGYGGEAAYINLSKEAYDFWKPVVEEHGDSDIVTYMVGAEDGEYDLDEIESIPPEADFMKDKEGDGRPWYEHHDEFVHQNGVAYDSARLTIEEVDSEEYNAKVLGEIVEGEELSDYMNNIMEESNWELDLVQGGDLEYYEPEGDHVLQFYSAEKGTFFDGILTSTGPFDPKKFKVIIDEFPNGEDIVTSIQYNGEDIENYGGDTNGKGYSVYLWTNRAG